MKKKNSVHIELQNFWPYQVVVLADKISRHTISIAKKEAGLNISQWRVLAAVAEKPGRTAADVTTITPMDKTIVSRAVKSLIDLNLIEKTQNTHDKRSLSLTMTANGEFIYANIATQLKKALIDGLKGDVVIEDFIKTLKEYSAKMDNIHPPSQ